MAGIYNATARATEAMPGKVNNAGIYPVEQIMAAGIDPRSVPGLKVSKCGYDSVTLVPKNGGGGPCYNLKSDNKRVLRIHDEQEAINSITWYNLPNGVDAHLMEMILYYRGQGIFFYLEQTDKFYFLPFSLGTKGIDCYGRYKSALPLPFTGAIDDGDPKVFLPGLELDCRWDIELGQLTAEEIMKSGVIIRDYSPQLSQNVISRQILNDPICDLEADMLPFARTALLNSTGVLGMRVNSQDEQANVEAASRAINRAALEGKKYVPVIGNIDFQEMTSDKIATADAFLMTMQSIDNYRLSLHGVDSGGIFQKQAHMLESENQMNASKSSFAMQDRLWQRQHACDIINSYFGLDMWCDVSQPALGVDQDMDGSMYDNDPETVSYDSQEEPSDEQ